MCRAKLQKTCAGSKVRVIGDPVYMFGLIGKLRSSKGVTLIEMVIAASIALIGAMGGLALFTGVKGTIAGNSAAVQAEQEARNIVERIAREIRESAPDQVWLYDMNGDGSEYINFLTPRDSNRKFIVDANGRPLWQRTISYGLDTYSNTVYRYQYFTNYDGETGQYESFEIVSKNVEDLRFRISGDMVAIRIRTFTDQGQGTGNVSNTYADFHTTVKLRN